MLASLRNSWQSCILARAGATLQEKKDFVNVTVSLPGGDVRDHRCSVGTYVHLVDLEGRFGSPSVPAQIRGTRQE